MQYVVPARILPFRWIFPVGQLVLCLLIVSVVVAFRGSIPYVYADHIFQAIAAMNLPGALIQLPTAILTADHVIWRPPWMIFPLWHAISWSASAMVFWWIAGRAAEALVAIKYKQLTPKINWVETVTGFLLMAGGATIFCGGVIYGLIVARDWESTRLGAAGGLWALLGGLSVLARFRQSRLRKKIGPYQGAAANAAHS